MNNPMILFRKVVLLAVVLSLTACGAQKLRVYNLQLESLMETRTEAREEMRKFRNSYDPTHQESLRQLEQAQQDLAALAFEAAEDAGRVDDEATRVGYMFTAARAGSKAGKEALETEFKKSIKASGKVTKEEGKSAGAGVGSAPSEDDPTYSFYYSIVVPAKDLCSEFEDKWSKPARDCAYIEVAAYFAVVDDLVADGEAIKRREKSGKLPPRYLPNVISVFDGLRMQFGNIDNTATKLTTLYGVDDEFKQYLNFQLLRTYCSGKTMFATFKKIKNDQGKVTSAAKTAIVAKESPFADMKRKAKAIVGPDKVLEGYRGDSPEQLPDCFKIKSVGT